MHIRIDGTLNQQANKTHIPHAFSVPRGTTKLSIQFDYTPKQSKDQVVRNDLSLTLFDPFGVRGARHNNANRDVVITEHSATPGYAPGALPAGTWIVWIDAHRIMPPDTIQYWFDIELSDAPVHELPLAWKTPDLKSVGAGWYRGDLHGHTHHSDGRWDVPDLVQYGRDYQLDFVTLSDHNTVSGLAQMDSLASNELLTMGGMELTTYFGHALALGVRDWQEWRVGGSGQKMPQLAQRVMDSGGLFIIAHPCSIGDPYCTGCNWQYLDMMPGNARCVEIWNESWHGESGNEQALQLWMNWLNQGYRMVATVGTDIHGPLQDPTPGFNVVYAQDRTEKAILEAIRQGHLYLSSGPQLELTTDDGLMMGDLTPRAQVTLTLRWRGCNPEDTIKIIVNGAVESSLTPTPSGEHHWSLQGDGRQWCLVEIRAQDGTIRAITNPILMGGGWY